MANTNTKYPLIIKMDHRLPFGGCFSIREQRLLASDTKQIVLPLLKTCVYKITDLHPNVLQKVGEQNYPSTIDPQYNLKTYLLMWCLSGNVVYPKLAIAIAVEHNFPKHLQSRAPKRQLSW